MKTLTMRQLSRETARVLDSLERGESFEIKRSGRAIGYLTHLPPPAEPRPDWATHFRWLKEQAPEAGGFVAELDAERGRSRARQNALDPTT